MKKNARRTAIWTLTVMMLVMSMSTTTLFAATEETTELTAAPAAAEQQEPAAVESTAVETENAEGSAADTNAAAQTDEATATESANTGEATATESANTEDSAATETANTEDVAAVENATAEDASAAAQTEETATAETPAVSAKPVLDESGSHYTISESGDYTLTKEDVTDGQYIVIDGLGEQIEVRLVLDNVVVKADKVPAISLAAGVRLLAVISGNVELSGTNGIKVIEGSELIVEGAGGKNGTDSLTATGNGVHGNAIGYFAKDDKDAGNITIRNIHEVIATGGLYGVDTKKDNGQEGGAAIGGGRTHSAENGNVTIEHVGTLKAYGGSKAAAVGGNFWRGSTVTIDDVDEMYAEGGASSAAIGTSRNVGRDNRADLTEEKAGVSNTIIKINDSNITAIGGYYGAAIGTGYYNKSWGDYSRTAQKADWMPEADITISGNSTIDATGGQNAAAIGGGYKYYGPNITITDGVTVIARAGQAGKSGSLVPEAIGSGADGSGIFNVGKGSITIEEGATVLAFGHGYETVQQENSDKTGVLSSKWAIGRELSDEETTAKVLQVRLLVDNFFAENEEEFEELHFFNNDGEEHEVVITNLLTDETKTFTIPAGYTSFAVTVDTAKYDTFTITIDGEGYSFLGTRGYSAKTVATNEANTALNDTVYAGGENPEDADSLYRAYEFTYKLNETLTTVRYAFDGAMAGFRAAAGINSFDAVAVRKNVVAEKPVIEEPEEPVKDEESPSGQPAEEAANEDSTPAAATDSEQSAAAGTGSTPADGNTNDQAAPAAPERAAAQTRTAVAQTARTAVQPAQAATGAGTAAQTVIPAQAAPMAAAGADTAANDDDAAVTEIAEMAAPHAAADHVDSITHFLLALLTLLVIAVYTKRRKDVQADIHELEEQLAGAR